MTHRITLPSLLAGAVAIVALAACGNSTAASSSSSGANSGSSSTANSSTNSSSGGSGSFSTASCPSASTVGSAMGATLPAATTVDESGDLPSGATGIGCSYIAGTSVVIVVLASGVPSSYFSTEEQAQTSDLGSSINYSPISGLGDQAASYQYTADGLTASGVLALKGSDVVGVFTDGLNTSLSSEENLVRTLLG